MTRVAERQAERQRLYDAVPVGENNAKRAFDIAATSGVNVRSAGTRLTAMFGTPGWPGLCRRYVPEHGGVFVWWREAGR